MVRIRKRPSFDWNAKTGSIFLSWAAIILCFGLYSGWTETGPYGWVVYMQLKLFGSASMWVYTLLLMVVAYGPPSYLIRNLQRRGFLLNRQTALGPDSVTLQPASIIKTNKWSRYGTVVVVCLTPSVIATAAWVYARHEDEIDRNQTVYRMDLDRDGRLPANARLLTLSGVQRQDYEYSIEWDFPSREVRTYVPLTASTWTIREPVQYILCTSADREDVAPPRSC